MVWHGVIDKGGAVLSNHAALNLQLSKMGGKLENSELQGAVLRDTCCCSCRGTHSNTPPV